MYFIANSFVQKVYLIKQYIQSLGSQTFLVDASISSYIRHYRRILPLHQFDTFVVFCVKCFHAVCGVPRFPWRILLCMSSLCIRMGEGLRCLAFGAATEVLVLL